MSAAVVPVRPSDRARLARFFSRVEKGFFVDMDSPRWRWRMEANPAGSLRAWLFELAPGGEVVGYLGTIPVALDCAGRTLRAAWSIDLVADPEYRARGVTPFLYKAWLPTVDVALALGTTPDSLAYLLKSGWRHLGALTCHRRVLRPQAYLPRAARPLGRMARTLTAPPRPRRGEAGALSWDADLDALWTRSAPEGGAVRRDRAYASWRFRDCPDPGYEVLALKASGHLEGVAVLREKLQRGRRIGLVVDLWASPDWLADLVDHAVQALDRRGVDVVQVYATHAALGSVLRKARFLPRATTLQVLARPAGGVEVPERLDAWWITLGDSDQDPA